MRKLEQNTVLVALMPSNPDWAIALSEHWYRLPLRSAPSIVRAKQLTHIAFYFPKEFGEEKQSIRWQAEVEGIAVKKPRPVLAEREHLEQTSRQFRLKYLLGIMNSSVARGYLMAIRRSNLHIFPDDWKPLPIPAATLDGQRQLEKLVEKRLGLAGTGPAERQQAEAMEREIDQVVFGLYGLTEEEVKIVEGSGKRKRKRNGAIPPAT